MVNIFGANTYLRWIMKLVGLSPQKIEIEPGTIMNVWSPTGTTSDKPAVVLLHGFALDGMHTWMFQALSLAGNYALYVPDFIFFGGSTTDRPDRTVAFQAQCVARALDRLGVGRCILVGLSYGGFVSFELAGTYPELVEYVVANNTVMTLTESISASCFKRFADDYKVVVSRWSELLLPKSARDAKTEFEIGTYKLPSWIPDCIFSQLAAVISDHRKEKVELLEAAVIPDDDKDPNKIPTISQRVCLLWGENDKIFPMEVAYSLKEKLGDKATLESIEKAGHLALLERPFAFNRRLNEILASFVKANRVHSHSH